MARIIEATQGRCHRAAEKAFLRVAGRGMQSDLLFAPETAPFSVEFQCLNDRSSSRTLHEHLTKGSGGERIMDFTVLDVCGLVMLICRALQPPSRTYEL